MTHRQLKDRTRAHYRWLLDDHLIPEFGSKPLASITSDEVRSWFTGFGAATPTVRSHAYGLLRSILSTAASDGKIGLNPCVIRGAAITKRKHQIRPASLHPGDARAVRGDDPAGVLVRPNATPTDPAR